MPTRVRTFGWIAAALAAALGMYFLFDPFGSDQRDPVDSGRASQIGQNETPVPPQLRASTHAASSTNEGRSSTTDQPVATLTVGNGPQEWKVQVVDSLGEPVAGARLSFLSLWAEKGRLPAMPSRATNANGEVLVRGGTSKGGHRISVDPPNSRADLARIVIEDWSADESTITLPRGYSVRGVVLDVEDSPLPNALVFWRRPGGSWVGTRADGRGKFGVSGLAAGGIDVRASTPLGYGDIVSVVDVASIERELILSARAGGRLQLKIEAYDRSHLGSKAVLSVDDPKFAAGKTFAAGIAEDGTASFIGLNPNQVYRLYVGPGTGSDRVVYAGGLRPSPDLQRVRHQTGYVLSGVLESPVDRFPPFVSAVGPGFQARAIVESDGAFEIRGMPDAPVQLIARLQHEGVRYEGRVTATPPDRIRLQLK